MNKDFFMHNLKIIGAAVNQIQQNIKLFTEQTTAITLAVCASIGMFESDTNYNNDISTFQIMPPKQISSGLDNLMEELKKMIINLNISGSVRTRKNGLIELRTQAFGSIYGRTKAEIEEKLNKKIKEEIKTKNTKTKKTLFISEFFQNNYLPYKKANLSENSIKSINSIFKNLKDFDKPLNKYTAIEIETFLYSIPQTRTRQMLQCLLNNLFNYAKRLNFIKNNPCDNVEKMKHTKKIGRALSFQDQYAFFENLYSAESKTTMTEKLYLTFVYLTGTRRNEALSIKQNDIDYQSNVIHIPGTKTKTSKRTIPMFPLVKKLLKKTKVNNGKVFDISYNQVKNVIEKTQSKYHLHELRHTFGTIGICVKKLDAKTVAMYMGHSDTFTTLNTYTHPEQLDEQLFYNGSLSENEKTKILRTKYNKVLSLIERWLNSIDQ